MVNALAVKAWRISAGWAQASLGSCLPEREPVKIAGLAPVNASTWPFPLLTKIGGTWRHEISDNDGNRQPGHG